MVKLDERINEVSNGNMGVFMALLWVKNNLGDVVLSSFLDKVSERGEELWMRFRKFQEGREGMGFEHFVAFVLTGGSL